MAACGGSGNESDETTGSLTAAGNARPFETATATQQTVLTNYAKGIEALQGVWPGYRPETIPTVIALANKDGELDSAVTIAHGQPSAIGIATPIDTSQIGLRDVFLIAELKDPDELAAKAPFVFSVDIGGENTFVLIGSTDEPALNPDSNEFTALLIHEQFHRYQMDNFSAQTATQDVEGYDYSPQNIELAMLEDRIHIALKDAETIERQRELGTQLIAIRAMRFKQDSRVELDEDQERFEGTARYVQSRIGKAIGSSYTDENYVAELAPGTYVGVKEHFGFSRFYSTGASVMGLLDALAVDDVRQRIQDGMSPMGVLTAAIPVEEVTWDNLIVEARAEQDPDAELPAIAREASETAVNEPAVFGGSNGAAQTGQGGNTAMLTEEQRQCLVDNGFDFTGQSDTIPQELIDLCHLQ